MRRGMLVLGVLGLVGCNEHWEAAVWSEDGEAVARVRQEMSCSSGLFGSSCSEVGDAELVVDGDALDLDWAPRWPADTLYYQRSAGYVIYETDQTLHGEWDPRSVVVDACDGDLLWVHRGWLLPSWDGSVVATLEMDGEDVWVRFLSGSTGALHRERVVEQAGRVDWDRRAWVSDEELRLGFRDGRVMAFFVDGRVETAEEPASWFPGTLSSVWNDERGEVLGGDANFAWNSCAGSLQRCSTGHRVSM